MFVFLSGTGTNGNLKRNLLPGVTTTSTRKVPVPVHRNRGILTSLMRKGGAVPGAVVGAFSVC
jgi:hypothetical protein